MSSRKKIADYFGITVEELMGTKKEPAGMGELDKQMQEIVELLNSATRWKRCCAPGQSRSESADKRQICFGRGFGQDGQNLGDQIRVLPQDSKDLFICHHAKTLLFVVVKRKEENQMKILEKCKVIAAGTIVAALMAGTALPALAASPAGDVPFAVLAQQNSAVTPEQVEALISQIGTVARSRRAAIVAALDAYNQLDDAGKAAVTNFGVLAEAQQILGIQDALAKCNVNYDAVEDCWAITTPHDDSIDKRKTCGIGPNLYIWDKGNTIVFWEDFTYIGSSELDIDDIILRGGDYKYTYICDYDNSDYGYDKELGKWFAWATFEMEDSEVEWLRNLLSADTVIMRFEGTDYSKFDYTWTVQDRQAITDIIDLYNLLKAVTPEVREKALRN